MPKFIVEVYDKTLRVVSGGSSPLSHSPSPKTFRSDGIPFVSDDGNFSFTCNGLKRVIYPARDTLVIVQEEIS